MLLRPNPAAHARNPYFLQLSVLKLRRYTSLHYFRHISLFVQELDVAIDWQLFIAVGEGAVRLSKPFYAKPAEGAAEGEAQAASALTLTLTLTLTPTLTLTLILNITLTLT